MLVHITYLIPWQGLQFLFFVMLSPTPKGMYSILWQPDDNISTHQKFLFLMSPSCNLWSLWDFFGLETPPSLSCCCYFMQNRGNSVPVCAFKRHACAAEPKLRCWEKQSQLLLLCTPLDWMYDHLHGCLRGLHPLLCLSRKKRGSTNPSHSLQYAAWRGILTVSTDVFLFFVWSF